MRWLGIGHNGLSGRRVDDQEVACAAGHRDTGTAAAVRHRDRADVDEARLGGEQLIDGGPDGRLYRGGQQVNWALPAPQWKLM